MEIKNKFVGMSHHFAIKILAFALCFLIFTQGRAQVMPKEEPRKPIFHNDLSFFVAPAYTAINSDNLKNDKYASTGGNLAPSAGLSYFIQTGYNVGYVIGLEYNMYANTTLYKGYFRAAQTKLDPQGFVYYPLVDANYSSKLTMNCIDLPVSIRLQHHIKPNIIGFVDAGVRLNMTLSYVETLDGYSNKKGLYPLSGVKTQYLLVEDEPARGFVNTGYANSRQNIKSSRANFSYGFGAGVKAVTSKTTFILVKVGYVKGINDLNDNTDPQYTNVFGDKSGRLKYTLFQMSFGVGFGIKI